MSVNFVIAQSYLDSISEENETRTFNPVTAGETEFKEFMVSLFLDLKSEKLELNRRIDEQNIKIQDLSEQVKSLETENNLAFDFKDQEIKDLKEENKSLREEINLIKEDVRAIKAECKDNLNRSLDLERHSRGFNLRFPKIPEPPPNQKEKEDCIAVIKSKLETVGLGHVNIENAHRTGPESTNPEKPRSLICRFSYRPERRAVLRAKNQLFQRGIPVFEDLIKSDLEIKMKYAATIKKHFDDGKRVWFSKGYYYINGKKQVDMV